jgi:murein L,D-transpeptidase YcbB/YkuD
MSGIRFDHLLAGAVVALLLAAPACALAQETAPTPAEVPVGSSGEAPPATADVVPTAPSTPASVSEQVPVPDPLTSLDPADRAIAARIRDLLAQSNHIFADEKEYAAVEAFYQNRNMQPLWLDKGVENTRATAVIAHIKHADADGLDPSDYRTPDFVGLAPDVLADAELTLTQAVLTYARHLQAGRSPHRAVREDNIGLPQRAPNPAAVLAAVAEAADARTALDQFSPPYEQYQKLKAMLAQLRGRTAGGARDEIAAGPVLSLNRNHPMEDARVPRLRERLGVLGEATDLRYDAALAEAVKEFQRANDLPVTGKLDARTIKKLNPTKDGRIDTVIANMERWRWYPRELRTSRVEVNEPDFTLRVVHEGRLVWTSRVVIGKPSMPSPLLAQQMDSITINPTWAVPQSIVRNEYLPVGSGTLASMGIRVKRVDGEVQMTMPPGGQNPLGRIRFNFFNRFTVFQHDTPDQYLFAHVVRAESHGCMRVQDAAKYAEVLAGIVQPEEHWTVDKIKSLYSGDAEHEISLGSGPIWIYLTYQTAFVDDAGKLQMRRDLYSLDSRTLAAIKSTHATANPAPERKSGPEIAAPEPAVPVQRHKVAHRVVQTTAPPSIFFASGARPVRQQPVRGFFAGQR